MSPDYPPRDKAAIRRLTKTEAKWDHDKQEPFVEEGGAR